MKLIALITLSLLLTSIIINTTYAQEPTRKIETITVPYTAANTEKANPVHYSFSSKHIGDWILQIRNELMYNTETPEAKVVIRLMNDISTENYIEVAMFGAPSQTFWLSLANEEMGYSRFFEGERSWAEDKPVVVSYIQNDRLSVSNGIRNVMDKVKIGPFVLNTVEVYGKDSADAPVNTFGGQLVFDIVSGDPMENPIMLVPAILAAAAGATVLTLIKIKKRT